jgi:hypothetical protein
VIGKLRERQAGMRDAVKAIAWKAQERLCGRTYVPPENTPPK